MTPEQDKGVLIKYARVQNDIIANQSVLIEMKNARINELDEKINSTIKSVDKIGENAYESGFCIGLGVGLLVAVLCLWVTR